MIAHPGPGRECRETRRPDFGLGTSVVDLSGYLPCKESKRVVRPCRCFFSVYASGLHASVGWERWRFVIVGQRCHGQHWTFPPDHFAEVSMYIINKYIYIYTYVYIYIHTYMMRGTLLGSFLQGHPTI